MGSQIPWWEVAKAQSLQRKAKAATSSSGVNAGDAFLIVTEGEVTEPVYFEFIRRDLQLSAVKIRVEPGKASHPRHVIASAAAEVKEHARLAKRGRLANTDPKIYEQVWAVIDTDVATRQGIWNDIEKQAKDANVQLAFSTPCFEYWLLLHIQGLTTRGDLVNGDTAKSAVKHALGRDYSTTRVTAGEVIPSCAKNWPKAVLDGERVREYHRNAASKIPANPSSEVCALVRALNDSAPEHLRRLDANGVKMDSNC